MKRIYENLIEDHFDSNRQMVFISGLRQTGKTALAESVLPDAVRINYDKAADACIITAA